MIGIEDLTKDQLFDIADIAAGGKFLWGYSTDQKEIETGGYGKRRLLTWNFENEQHYFEINASAKDRGWHWYAWCIDVKNKKYNIHCLNHAAIVDYCDKHGIDVRNKMTTGI